MSLLSFLLLLVIAAVCGFVGQAFAGRSVGGFVVSAGVGLVGAWLGMWIAGTFGLPTVFVVDVGGVDFPLVWSILGSALLVALLGAFRGR